MVLFGGAVLAGVEWGRLHLGRGEWETLAGSVFFTGQILWLDRPGFRANHVLRFTLVMFIVMALSTLPIAMVTARHPADLVSAYASPAALGLLAVLVALCTLVSFILANRWQPEVHATEAGLLYSTEPVFASLLVLFLPGIISRGSGVEYPNEQLTWNLLVGGGLILAANLGLQFFPVSKPADRPPAPPSNPAAIPDAAQDPSDRSA